MAQGLTHNGWMAVLTAILSVLIYIAGLMCSHVAAFRVATNIRRQAMRQIVRLPLGVAEAFGSGKLRKIVNESSAATETYLAHQLPDRAGAIATPCGLLVLLFAFDWRLGLLSLIPVALGFLIMMSMTGAKMRRMRKCWQWRGLQTATNLPKGCRTGGTAALGRMAVNFPGVSDSAFPLPEHF